MLKNSIFICCLFFVFIHSKCFVLAQYNTSIQKNELKKYTAKDTILGTLNKYRVWWDVLHYDICIEPNLTNKTISGSITITFKAIKSNHILQIDLQKPLIIDSVFEIVYYKKKQHKKYISIAFKTDSITTLLTFQKSILKNQTKKIIVFYHGIPHEAITPPWDGGIVWAHDTQNNPFVSVACQGIGASVWLPCKDHLSDEPNDGIDISIITPDTLVAAANGLLVNKIKKDKKCTWHWKVKNPINNYNINFTIGKLINFGDTLHGENGILNMNYWVLQHHLEKAKEHFKIVKPILRCFEYWFGPYPFYNDDYKIIETPFLGMEHQSGIAYGNGYSNGYKGKDLSKTNWGLKWDFILVHESGHEWFGNNISIADRADMWVNESFTNYSETLFTEWLINSDAANEYCFGIRANIKNDKPMIANYGVNEEGSSDIYYKGGNMLHSIRNAVYDDKKFRSFLRHINSKFYHQVVSSRQIENEFCKYFNFDFKPVFKQFLHTIQIPELDFYFQDNEVFLRWTNCITNFNLPIIIPYKKTYKIIYPTTHWKHFSLHKEDKKWWLEQCLKKLIYVDMKQTN